MIQHKEMLIRIFHLIMYKQLKKETDEKNILC